MRKYVTYLLFTLCFSYIYIFHLLLPYLAERELWVGYWSCVSDALFTHCLSGWYLSSECTQWWCCGGMIDLSLLSFYLSLITSLSTFKFMISFPLSLSFPPLCLSILFIFPPSFNIFQRRMTFILVSVCSGTIWRTGVGCVPLFTSVQQHEEPVSLCYCIFLSSLMSSILLSSFLF